MSEIGKQHLQIMEFLIFLFMIKLKQASLLTHAIICLNTLAFKFSVVDKCSINVVCSILVQHEKAATFLHILKSFFHPTLVRV